MITQFYTPLFTLLATIIVIGILIFVHEFGHFLVAKLIGVKVEIFSLGFGPKLFAIKGKETEYRLSLIPLGGYVKLYGEHSETASSLTEPEKAFAFKKPWQKSLVVIAGPLANFVLAFIVFWFLFSAIGIYTYPPKVGEVIPGSPAEKVGIKKGDIILEVNGVKVNSFEEMVLLLRGKQSTNIQKLKIIKLKIKRDNKILNISVTPEFKEGLNIFGKKTKIPIIGIKATQELVFKKYNILDALLMSLKKVGDITVLTFTAIYKLFIGELPFSTLGGPITIAKIIGDTAKMGLIALLSFTALLSINLGVINILPIPMLDGSYLILFGIEAIRGKPLSLKTQELIFKIGLALIIILSIAVFYNDIYRLLTGWKMP